MPDPTIGLESVKANPTTDNPDAQPMKPPKIYDLTQPLLTLTNNITIRHHRHSDAEALSKHASNPKIARNMTNRFPNPYTVDKSHEWISMCRNESNWKAIGPTDPKSNDTDGLGQKLPHAWVIALDDEAIGGVGFQPQTDIHSRRLAFGYWLGEEYWGKGIMSIVVPAFIEWIWETYPWVVKLEPSTYGWNKGSARVMEKAGFVLEGRLRCAIVKDGVIGDELIFGMVREGVVASEEPPPV